MPTLHHLALVGCGGMSRRHLRGYHVLEEFEPGRLQVTAVVDPDIKRAEFLGGEAEGLFGNRPKAFHSLEDAVAACPELDVVDIVAAAGVHHSIAEVAFEAGLHVQTEKPMAPTVTACHVMQNAAEKHGGILSVAENFRRDPIRRLAHALIQAGTIGEIRTVIEHSASGGRIGRAAGWRYQRKHGGPVLEQAVHFADMQIYLVGPVQNVTAQVRLQENERIFKGIKPKTFHEHTAHDYPDSQTADAPDLVMANLQFASGAWGQWLFDETAQGAGFRRFTIYGSEGQMDLPSARSGRPLNIYREGQREKLTDEEVLALVPDFALDARTTHYFGSERIAHYEVPGSTMGARESDLKLLALEISEMLDAIDNGTPVEVGAEEGLAPVALIMAFHESSEAKRTVSMAEILDGSLSIYQDVANWELGL